MRRCILQMPIIDSTSAAVRSVVSTPPTSSSTARAAPQGGFAPAGDVLTQVAPARWLVPVLPRHARHGESMASIMQMATSGMRILPHYGLITRQVYRAMGGPLQPLAGPIWASLAADATCHQILPRLYEAVRTGTLQPFAGFFPNPVEATCLATFGLAVGLYKLACFEENVTLHNLALALTGGNADLIKPARRLLESALDPYADADAVGLAMLRFVEAHPAALPSELRDFAERIRAGDLEACCDAEDLWYAVQRYAQHGDRQQVPFIHRVLVRVAPTALEQAQCVDPRALLASDAVKVSAAVGFLAVEWAVLGGLLALGNPRAWSYARAAPQAVAESVMYLAAFQMIAMLANAMLAPGEPRFLLRNMAGALTNTA
jgi:hypothetical protein